MSKKLGIWEVCVRAWNAGDLSTCKPLGFDLLGWVAILTAVIGLAWFTARHTWNWASSSASTTTTVRGRPWRSRFKALCAAIQPIMIENGKLFREFGPNSGRGDGSPKIVRQSVDIWKQLLPKVVANNARIRELIAANRQAIPREHAPLFQDWINHIDAFEAHSLDDLADYRDNQFPVEVVDLVCRNA